MKLYLSRFYLLSLLVVFAGWLLLSGNAAANVPTIDSQMWQAHSNAVYTITHALKLVEKNKKNEAFTQASRTGIPLVYDVVKWAYYIKQPGGNTFEELSDFIKRHPDWPKQGLLRAQAEQAMGFNEPNAKVIAWYTALPPQTAYGKWKLANAYLERKRQGKPVAVTEEEITQLIKDAWKYGNFTEAEEGMFFTQHKNRLTQKDLIERIDRLLWQERTTQAARWIDKVPPKYRTFFYMRMRLIKGHSISERDMATLDKDFTHDPGLIYALLRLKEKKNDKQGVYELLTQLSVDSEYSNLWWPMLERQIRRLTNEKSYKQAYMLAANHGQQEKISTIEAEWLAGWLALRFLHQPELALAHFKETYRLASLPISVSRASYWTARAYQAMGRDPEATEWYRTSAQFPTTFYGQLAQYHLAPEGNLDVTIEKPVITPQDEQWFRQERLTYVSWILAEANYPQEAKWFIESAVDRADSIGKVARITEYMQTVGRYDLSINAAFQGIKQGRVVVGGYYPLYPKLPRRENINKALILGIMRQESRFNSRAQSDAGAIGMMQLMPATAHMVASSLKIDYAKSRLENADYNITLGSEYIQQLLEKYHSVVLAVAAYNAGTGNVSKWIKERGDIREFSNYYDVLDWIESIPFAETRNYTERVIEAMHVYDSLMATAENRPPLPAKKPVYALLIYTDKKS